MTEQQNLSQRQPPAPVTAAEFWEVFRKSPCELVQGNVVSLPPPASGVAPMMMKLACHLEAAGDGKLGIVCIGRTGFQVRKDPDSVLSPSVSFIARARIPAKGIPPRFWPAAPDLAVDLFRSASDLKRAEARALEWILSGAREVWLISLHRRQLRRYRKARIVEVLSDKMALESELFPGLSLPLGGLFG